MRRIPLVLTIPLIAAVGAPLCLAEGNANFVIGTRTMDKASFWRPNDEMTEFGATIGFGPDAWPVNLAVGVYVSAEQKKLPLFTTEETFTTAVFELSLGFQKIWKRGAVRPFVGAGVAELTAASRREIPGESVFDHDRSHGVYAEGGIFWRVGSAFNVGVAVRKLAATKISFDVGRPRGSGDASYYQAGLLLGFGWPGK